MQIFWFCLGIAFIFVALLDAFQTVISPRRATGRFRITRIFYIVTWWPWSHLATRIRHPRKRETALSFYGPLSLLLLIVVWAVALLIGFALLFHSQRAPIADAMFSGNDLRSDLYLSGTTIFTLGIGDLTPHSSWARLIIVLESGIGLGFLAMVISYFPVLYGAFSRREVNISFARCARRLASYCRGADAAACVHRGAATLSNFAGGMGAMVGGTAGEPYLLSAALLLPLAAYQPELAVGVDAVLDSAP